MSPKCTAPVTGRHKDARTKSQCPSCGGSPVRASATPNLSAPPPQPFWETVDDVQVAAAVGMSKIQEEINSLQAKLLSQHIDVIAAGVRTLCPSASLVEWNTDTDKDYMYETEVFVHCDHSGGVAAEMSKFHDQDASWNIMLSMVSLDISPDCDTPPWHNQDYDRYDGGPLSSDDGPVLSIDMLKMHAVRELDVDPDNAGAIDHLRTSAQWWTLDKDSPEVKIALALNQNPER